MLEQHFDALLYIANRGSKQLAFRFPIGALTLEQLQPFLLGDEESYVGDVHMSKQHLVLNLEIREEEGYGWIEDKGLLDPLIPLREAILRGDLRALYLFWLRCAAECVGYADDDEEAAKLVEPPVPPGLGQLDPALDAFAEIFAIDHDLIAAAAEASPALKVTREPLERWVTLLPDVERNRLLLRVARGEANVGIALLKRLQEVGGVAPTSAAVVNRRTFAQLENASKRQQQLRTWRELEAAERARLAKLEALAKREIQAWATVPTLLAKRTASGYDEGVNLLAELRDLAVHRDQRPAFETRLAQLLAPYAASPALQRPARQRHGRLVSGHRSLRRLVRRRPTRLV